MSPPLEMARHRMRRASLHRSLEAVAFGAKGKLSIDLREKDDDFVLVLDQVTRPLACDSPALRRLMAEFRNSGIADEAAERLSAKNRSARIQSARILGALRMPQAVTWLAPLLRSKDHAVSDAAARALGRIGGLQSARVLLAAIQRTGLRRTLIGELARAAPDLFLEVTLSERQRPGLKPAAALAAGLRRRHTAVGPLVALLMHGTPRERVISCRALGWIGSSSALPAITAAVEDPERRVRLAAGKALRILQPVTKVTPLKQPPEERRLSIQSASDASLGNLLRELRI
jgi:HEAT repeat protein